MKTKLLTAILIILICLSNIAKSQIIRTTSSNQFPISNSSANLQDAINHQATISRSLIQKNDSIYRWKWDIPSKTWMIQMKDVEIIYDTNNNLISYIQKQWNINSWQNYSKSIFTYDDKNNLTNKVVQFW